MFQNMIQYGAVLANAVFLIPNNFFHVQQILCCIHEKQVFQKKFVSVHILIRFFCLKQIHSNYLFKDVLEKDGVFT